VIVSKVGPGFGPSPASLDMMVAGGAVVVVTLLLFGAAVLLLATIVDRKASPSGG
jgi:hypothetical protein